MTSTLVEWWAARKPHFRCPQCGAISFNPHDISERYCGRCHLFFTKVKMRPKLRQPDNTVVEERRRASTSDDSSPVISFPTSSPGWLDPAPNVDPSPGDITPGGGSSGGGGASSDY